MPRCVSQYHSLPFRPQSIFKASASLVILVSTCPIRAHPSSEHLCAILVTAENIGTSQGAGWVYPPIAKNPRGENFSCDGGHAVLRTPAETFLAGGGVSARIPASMTRMYALCARAPKRPADQRRYRLRRAALFCHISSAVLRLWHAWHRLWRLLRSVNLDQSPRCGSMWSTSVARTRRPFLEHSRQNGSRRSCMGRMSWVHSSVEYIQRQALDSSLRRSLSLGLCASQ